MGQLTSPDPQFEVTVCIANWRGAPWLADCLLSLRKVQGLRCEVILVDNASDDASVDLVRAGFPEVQLILNTENLGFAKANNQAIRRGRGRYFFILNNDAVLNDGCLEHLVQFLHEHPRAGVVAGRLVNADGSIQYSYYPVSLPSLPSLVADLLWINRLWPRGRLGRGRLARDWNPDQPYRMEQVPGACMLVRREVFEELGLFDEGYLFWYEDVDLCARCLRAGWEIWYLPGARILHRGGASFRLLDFSSRSLLRFRSMLRYARSYFTPGRFKLLKLMMGWVLVFRMPLIIMAHLWPSATAKEFWKGGWQTYSQLLKELVATSSTKNR